MAAAAIRVDRDVGMTTRDGVVLRADVVRPEVAEPAPALVLRTPYDKRLRMSSFAHLRFLDAARAGYAVVFQDVRGRFASDGEWVVMGWDDVEKDDGYDCVEWVASEPWCDGNVGMIGASYEGLNALAAAQANPPSLRAIAPALLGSANGRRTTMMLEGVILSWSAMMAVDVLEKRRASGNVDPADFAKVMATLTDPASAASTLPLDELVPLTIEGMPSYEELTGRILTASNAVTGAVDRVGVPTLWTTGWWDHAGGSDLFRAVRASGATEAAREETKMIVGPWSHTQHDVHLGELGFGQLASLLSGGVGPAHLAFFDRHLRSVEAKPLPNVRYFLTGRNRWQEAESWPPADTSRRLLHFHAEAGARSVAGDGRLTRDAPSVEEATDRYDYDPASPVPAIGWKALNLGGSSVPGPFHQDVVERREDVLVYTSDLLEEPLEAVGDATCRLFVATTAPDTDFMVKLCDVDPDGTSRSVADGMVRLRWRHGGDEPRFVTPGEPLEIEVDLGMVGHAFLAGHRLRCQVASSAFPHFDRNMNTANPPGRDVEGVVARQTIYRERGRASRLELSVRDGTK